VRRPAPAVEQVPALVRAPLSLGAVSQKLAAVAALFCSPRESSHRRAVRQATPFGHWEPRERRGRQMPVPARRQGSRRAIQETPYSPAARPAGQSPQPMSPESCYLRMRVRATRCRGSDPEFCIIRKQGSARRAVGPSYARTAGRSVSSSVFRSAEDGVACASRCEQVSLPLRSSSISAYLESARAL
jgi:hypothetical protein